MSSPADRPVITIEELGAEDPHEVASFYQRILLPSFRAAELVGRDDFSAGLKSGQTRALVARTAQRVLAGGAVGDFFARSRVLRCPTSRYRPKGGEPVPAAYFSRR